MGDVPPEFGRELVLFEPIVEQSVSGGVSECSETQTEPKGVLEPCEVQTGSEGVLESSEALFGSKDSPGPMSEGVCAIDVEQSGPKHSSATSEAQTRLAPVFLERLEDPFIHLDRVGDLEEGDSPGSNSPIEIVQPMPIQIPKPSEGQSIRRFKTFVGRTNLHLSQSQSPTFWTLFCSFKVSRNTYTYLHKILRKILPKILSKTALNSQTCRAFRTGD